MLLTSSFLATTLIYLFSITIWIGLQSVSNLVEKWGQVSEMTVYLRPESNSNQIEKIRKIFSNYSNDVTAHLQSPEMIRENLNNLMPKNKVDFSNNNDFIASIPPHFIVKGNSQVLGNELYSIFENLSRDLRHFPFIESTSYGKSWLEKYNLLIKSFTHLNGIILISLILTLILVIGNTIRAHINSKREEIEILELVGATPSMIRKPFLLEGFLISTGSMIVSLWFSTFGFWLIKNSSFEILRVLDLKTIVYELSTLEWLLWLLLSAGIGLLGSHLCLSEINTGWYYKNNKHSFFINILRMFGLKNASNQG